MGAFRALRQSLWAGAERASAAIPSFPRGAGVPVRSGALGNGEKGVFPGDGGGKRTAGSVYLAAGEGVGICLWVDRGESARKGGGIGSAVPIKLATET